MLDDTSSHVRVSHLYDELLLVLCSRLGWVTCLFVSAHLALTLRIVSFAMVNTE